MKLLLLATLLSAGATAQRIRAWAVWQFSNVFQCTICGFHPVTQYNDYGCYCGLRSPDTPVYELDRCCWTWDNCYDQAKNLESCKLLTDNPYTSSYSYLCSGNEVTCSDKNNACEAFICNCDQQATICFSMAPYTL